MLVLADRIALGGDAGPVAGGVAQSFVGRQTPRHDQALARTPGDRSHPAQTAKCFIVPPLYGVATLGSQRGEHLGADTGHREQDGASGGCFDDSASASVDASGSSAGAASAS